MAPIGDPFGSNKAAEIHIDSAQEGMTLAVIIQCRKAGEPDRSYERPQEVVTLVGNIGSKPVNFSSIPREGTDIWSHCSWAVFKHRIDASEGNQNLTLRLTGEPPAGTTRLVTALWLK